MNTIFRGLGRQPIDAAVSDTAMQTNVFPQGEGYRRAAKDFKPDLFIPGQVQILFKTERPENNTLSSGKSLYTPHKGVTPPPGTLPSENFYLTTNFII